MGNSLCSLFCSFFLFKRGQMPLTLRLQPILVPTPSRLCSTTVSKPLPLFVAPISCLCIRGNTTAIPSFVHFITFWIVRQRLSLTACSGRDKSNLPFLLLLFRELCCFLYLCICAETMSCKCQWCRMKAHLLLSPRVLLNSLSLSFSLPISCTHTTPAAAPLWQPKSKKSFQILWGLSEQYLVKASFQYFYYKHKDLWLHKLQVTHSMAS